MTSTAAAALAAMAAHVHFRTRSASVVYRGKSRNSAAHTNWRGRWTFAIGDASSRGAPSARASVFPGNVRASADPIARRRWWTL